MPSNDRNAYSTDNQIDVIELSFYREGWERQRWVNLKEIMEEVDLYESIDGLLSGVLMISDAYNLPDALPIVGGECILLEFRTPSAQQSVKVNLRVFNVEGGIYAKGDSSKVSIQKLHLCSEARWKNASTMVSKAYRGTYSDIASQIVSEIGGQVKVDPSLGLRSYICPFWTPLRAAAWVSSRTSDSSQSPFLFFETADGFNLRSLKVLESAQSNRKFFIQPKIMEGESISPDQRHSIVAEYELLQRPNWLEILSCGGLGGAVHQWDIYGNIHDARLEYDSIASSTTLVDKYKAPTPKKNGDWDIFLLQRQDGSQNTEIQRRVLLKMVDATAASILVPGDSGLRAGMIVDLDVPSRQASGNFMREKMTSGRWLVHSLRHIVRKESYRNVLTLARDSTSVEIEV